jgi:excisionase family DNA binding protein
MLWNSPIQPSEGERAMQQLLTVKEYAQLKRISENTVRRRIASGNIKVERFGRAVRVVPEEARTGYELVDLPSYLKTSKTTGKHRLNGQSEAVSEV